MPLFTYEIYFHFAMRRSLNIFSSSTCNSTPASNKHGHKHNNTTTIRRAKLNEAPSTSGLKTPRTQNANPTMDKVVTKDCYHETTMDENMNCISPKSWLIIRITLTRHFNDKLNLCCYKRNLKRVDEDDWRKDVRFSLPLKFKVGLFIGWEVKLWRLGFRPKDERLAGQIKFLTGWLAEG